MQKLLSSVVLLCLGLTILVPVQAEPVVQTQQFAAAPFSIVNVSGPFDVRIASGQPVYCLQLVGDPNTLAHVKAGVRNGVLYLAMQPKFKPTSDSRLLAIVDSRYINQIQYSGTGNVTGTNFCNSLSVTTNGSGTVALVGKNIDLRDLRVAGSGNVHILGIKSGLLTVEDNGSGNVNLDGEMVLQSVDYNGSGTLSINWVNSSDVKVTGHGQGRVYLAGIGTLLDATITNRVYLDAKYLHVKRAFVSTQELARADVWVDCSFATVATGTSNVYYYNDACSTGNYQQPPASALRMTGLDPNHLPVPPRPC